MTMDEDLKSASASMNEPHERPAYTKPSPVTNRKKPKNILKFVLVALAMIILVAAAGFALWYLKYNKDQKTAESPAATSPVTETAKQSSDIPDAALTETYKSTALSVGFKYPKTWKVSEANGGIRVESPNFNYTPYNLTSNEGLFRIYIRQGAREADGKYIGAGIAIKPSEKLTYSQPAIGQRTDTLLSSFGEDSADYFSFFLIAGNFQLNKNDTLGPDYGKEPDTYIVTGGYTTAAAVDDLATQPMALDYYQTTTAYKQAYDIIASLQLK